jgi:hypothetical protein
LLTTNKTTPSSEMKIDELLLCYYNENIEVNGSEALKMTQI